MYKITGTYVRIICFRMEIINVQSGINAFNLEAIDIVVNDESIMSIADETVIKV